MGSVLKFQRPLQIVRDRDGATSVTINKNEFRVGDLSLARFEYGEGKTALIMSIGSPNGACYAFNKPSDLEEFITELVIELGAMKEREALAWPG